MKFTPRTAVIAGSATAIALAGLAVAGPAFAKGHTPTAHPSASASAAPSTPTAPQGMPRGGMMGGRGGFDRGGMMGGRTIHSAGVAAQTDASGKTTYVNVASQSGTVVTASDSAITVKSADGVAWTWKITSTTVLYSNGAAVKGSAFKAGDVVEVSGTGTGDGATATFVVAGGMMGGHGMGGDGDGNFGHGPMGGTTSGSGTLAPVPSASASSTTACVISYPRNAKAPGNPGAFVRLRAEPRLHLRFHATQLFDRDILVGSVREGWIRGTEVHCRNAERGETCNIGPSVLGPRHTARNREE